MFDSEFEVMGLLARFFKGGLSIPAMLEMRFSKIKPWYDIFVLQSTEEEVIQELSMDEKGNRRELPKPARIREIVLERIEDRKKER